MPGAKGKITCSDTCNRHIEGNWSCDHLLMLRRCRLFLPEGFIWQAFRDFAVAFEYMANFRSNSLEMRTGDGYFLLHMDLKDSNGTCLQRSGCEGEED